MRDMQLQICGGVKNFRGCDFAMTGGANFRGEKVLR